MSGIALEKILNKLNKISENISGTIWEEGNAPLVVGQIVWIKPLMDGTEGYSQVTGACGKFITVLHPDTRKEMNVMLSDLEFVKIK